jgi:hypothetical protein
MEDIPETMGSDYIQLDVQAVIYSSGAVIDR